MFRIIHVCIWLSEILSGFQNSLKLELDNFKGKDPTVSMDVLHASWVHDAFVVYVGNTGDLRTRIGQLIRFRAGRAVGQQGGRYLWQLNNSEYLRMCWKETAKGKSASEKSDILRKLQDYYGSLPFANIQR